MTDAMDMNIDDIATNDFKISFESCSALRTLADVLANMLTTVELRIVKTPKFEGLVVEAVNANQIALVVAQIAAKVEMGSERTSFCIDTAIFKTCVKSAQAHFSIDMHSAKGDTSIELCAYELLSNTCTTKFRLPTLICESQDVRLEEIEYKYYLDIKTDTLKSIVRMALALKGEDITFRVQQPKSPQAKKCTVLTISSMGQNGCEQEHTYFSSNEELNGATSINAGQEVNSEVAASAELETKYKEKFAAKHLSDFLRSIDRMSLTLRLARRMPLVVHHKLGMEESYVCLVVAPHVNDD